MTNAISVKDRLKKQAIEDGKTMQDNKALETQFNADLSDAVMHRAKTYVDTGMAGSNGKYDKYFQLVKRKEFEKFISERVEI